MDTVVASELHRACSEIAYYGSCRHADCEYKVVLGCSGAPGFQYSVQGGSRAELDGWYGFIIIPWKSRLVYLHPIFSSILQLLLKEGLALEATTRVDVATMDLHVLHECVGRGSSNELWKLSSQTVCFSSLDPHQWAKLISWRIALHLSWFASLP